MNNSQSSKLNPASPGEVEAFEEELSENIKYLEANLHKLEPGNQGFIKNLISHYNINDWVSYKQKSWLAAAKIYIQNLPTYQEAQAEICWAPKILDLFKAVEGKLNWPRLRYYIDSNDAIHIYPSAKTDDLLCYRQDKGEGKIFLARISTSTQPGLVTFERSITEQNKDLLKKLFEAPIEELAINGKQNIHCCFCGLGLTDMRSTLVGYGPICAGKWGLPWGDEVETKLVDI